MENRRPPMEILNKSEKSSSKDIEDFINEGISNSKSQVFQYSSVILSNSDYSLDNMKLFDKDGQDNTSGNCGNNNGFLEDYLNRLEKSEDTTKSGLTQADDSTEMKTNVDMFYMNSFGKGEMEQNDFDYIKNLENQLFFFGNNLDNIETNLSYQFGLIENIKNTNMVPTSSTINYDYNLSSPTNSPYNINNTGVFYFDEKNKNTNQNQYQNLNINLIQNQNQNLKQNSDFSEDKSEKNSKDFSKELTYGEHIIYNKIETLQRMIKNMIMTIHEKYNNDSNLKYETFINESGNESIYDFTLAQMFSQKTQRKSALKLLASHGVIGSFFGSNGHRVQALQQEFNVNVSVTTKRIHFPGSNNKGVLLINGKLYNILKVLRPLYRAIQEEVIRLLIDDSVRIEPSKIRLEIEVLIPESLRFTMDRNKYFKQIMEMTGANIRVIKQTYEDGPVQERVLVLFGSQNEIELALEKIALMIQEDSGFKHYSYMNYPDLTIALNANDYTLKYHQKRNEIEVKCKKKYSS